MQVQAYLTDTGLQWSDWRQYGYPEWHNHESSAWVLSSTYLYLVPIIMQVWCSWLQLLLPSLLDCTHQLYRCWWMHCYCCHRLAMVSTMSILLLSFPFSSYASIEMLLSSLYFMAIGAIVLDPWLNGVHVIQHISTSLLPHQIYSPSWTLYLIFFCLLLYLFYWSSCGWHEYVPDLFYCRLITRHCW